jgi:hypothetical protein
MIVVTTRYDPTATRCRRNGVRAPLIVILPRPVNTQQAVENIPGGMVKSLALTIQIEGEPWPNRSVGQK